MPVPNDSPSVQGMVRADLETREQIGRERYGTALQPFNGRDALRDAYEEALDLACYLRQAIAERPREDVDAAAAQVRAELEPQLQRQADLIAEMRRQMRPLIRQSNAWNSLLRLCNDANRSHWDANGPGSYGSLSTSAIRAVLDAEPYHDQPTPDTRPCPDGSCDA
jgi:hypothetical protein